MQHEKDDYRLIKERARYQTVCYIRFIKEVVLPVVYTSLNKQGRIVKRKRDGLFAINDKVKVIEWKEDKLICKTTDISCADLSLDYCRESVDWQYC